MNFKTILMTTFCCLAFMYAQAQEKTRVGKYHLGVGLSIHSILDEGYAPMTFNALSPNLIFSFQRDKNQNRIGFGLDAVYGKLKYEGFDFFDTDLIDTGLFALYARGLDFGNEKTSLHLGAIVNYRIQFLLNFDVGNASYTAAASLGLYLSLDYQLSGQDKLSIHFKHPVLASIVRAPYTGFSQVTDDLSEGGDKLLPVLFYNPEVTHGFKFFRPSLELQLERKMASGKILVPKISIEYMSYEAINPIKYFRTNFSIGIKF